MVTGNGEKEKKETKRKEQKRAKEEKWKSPKDGKSTGVPRYPA